MYNYEGHVKVWGDAANNIKLEHWACTWRWARSSLPSNPPLTFLWLCSVCPGPAPGFPGLTSGGIWWGWNSRRLCVRVKGGREGGPGHFSPLPICLGWAFVGIAATALDRPTRAPPPGSGNTTPSLGPSSLTVAVASCHALGHLAFCSWPLSRFATCVTKAPVKSPLW